MTDNELAEIDPIVVDDDTPVRVTAGDYAYDGWLTGVIVKRSGAIRAIVEDNCGRLFIHNAGQLSLIQETRRPA